MGGEITDRVVAPIIPYPPVDQALVVHELMDGHELDGGDAEPLEVLD